MTQPSRICTNCGGEKVSVYARICHLCGAESEPTSATESPAESIGTDTPITPVNQTTAISGPFCISCGTQFTSTASFCINCGAPNPKTNPNPVNQISHSPVQSEVKKTTTQFLHTANHSLVWVVALIPIAALILDLIYTEYVASSRQWWSIWCFVFICVSISERLCKKDKKQLAQLSYDTGPLETSWTTAVPVYLYKRVAVAGGGYGYLVVWIVTFAILILSPAGFSENGESSLAQESARSEAYCDVGSCTFTNSNKQPGSEGCVNVSVTKGQTKITSLVCSGTMEAFSNKVVPVVFPNQQPIDLCLGSERIVVDRMRISERTTTVTLSDALKINPEAKVGDTITVNDYSGSWDDCSYEFIRK